jgi:hypothetical protein
MKLSRIADMGEGQTSVSESRANAADPEGRWLYRVGGLSALVLGSAYIVVIALYVPMGAPPAGAEARLTYLAGNPTAWWAILGLSVLTDFLFVPLTFALYRALKGIDRNVMLLASACVGSFVVIDLAVTWTNYAALLALSGNYTAAINDAQKALIVAAAQYPSVVLGSSLLGVYIILVPGLGVLLMSLVMLRGVFSKGTAYLGLITGLLGVVSVVGPVFASALGITVVIASVMTTVWVFAAGFRLYRLGQSY